MNRLNFFESIAGINYPDMLVHFFDQFIALKNLVEDKGTVNVEKSDDKSISFSIIFNNIEHKQYAINLINQIGGVIVIYNRPIQIITSNINDLSIGITLA